MYIGFSRDVNSTVHKYLGGDKCFVILALYTGTISLKWNHNYEGEVLAVCFKLLVFTATSDEQSSNCI